MKGWFKSSTASIWFWRVSILRCLIYGSYVAWGMFKAGTEGFDSWWDMTSMQHIKLAGDIVFVAFGGVVLAFIDNSVLTRLHPPGTVTSSTTVDTHTEINEPPKTTVAKDPVKD